jgi:hypothetical protein
MPLTVTFDTNTLNSVVLPKTAQRGTGASGATVRTAIQVGRIQGFFSETLITLEGIENKHRVEVLGKTRPVSKTSSTGPRKITIAVGFQHVRNPLNSQFLARVQAAVALGMRALRAPARMGGHRLKGENWPFLEPAGGLPELLRCVDNVNEMATKIAKRGVGQAVAVELGVQFSKRAGVSEPELFLQGLGRAQDKSECCKVAKAIAEWADGDSVAAHYGFGIDQFCSDDFAPPSVLHRDNRKWLSEEFGIQFVTLAELAKRVTA